MNIFEFKDYKKFVLETLKNRPNAGRGQFRKMAEHLEVSSVAISQVFRGPRDLSEEQAFRLSTFFHLQKNEIEFFLLLIRRARAGSQELKKFYDQKIDEIRTAELQLAKRVSAAIEINDQQRAVFYSNWQYSAIRIASSVPGLHSPERLAEFLDLKREDVMKAIQFLLEVGLCVPHPEGVAMGPSTTLLPADSPYINNHRRNWRLKGLERLHRLGDYDFFYSGVVSLSHEDLALLKSKFLDVIADFLARIEKSPSEKVACLNLDWFEIGRS